MIFRKASALVCLASALSACAEGSPPLADTFRSAAPPGSVPTVANETEPAAVVVSFLAEGLSSDVDATAVVLGMAAQPYVAEVGTSERRGEDGEDTTANLRGKLVFESEATYEAWVSGDMDDLFAPLGGVSEVARLDISRPEASASSSVGAVSRDMSITYQNTGNDAEGDADIDAVTVICPGDYADCKPSN